MMMSLVRRVALVLALCAWAVPARAQQDVRGRVCSECHKNMPANKDRALQHAQNVNCLTCHHLGLSNKPAQIAAARVEVCKGCHTKVQPTHTRGHSDEPTCTTCHSVHDDAAVKRTGLPSARCQTCHEKPHALHAGLKDKNAPQCTSCHKLHGEAPLQASSPAVSARCASCHKAPHPSHVSNVRGLQCTSCHSMASDAKLAAMPTGAQLSEKCAGCHKTHVGSHEGAKIKSADRKTPVCVDCHDFVKDPKIASAGVAISKRCGSCHQPELNAYLTGGHAKAQKGGRPNPDAPTCVTCHRAHGTAQGKAGLRLSATTKCVQCHSDERLIKKYNLPRYAAATYTRDYHGETNKFLASHPKVAGQSEQVMTCSDCHGAHAVGWTKQQMVADVCVKCHKNADVKLAGAWLGHGKPGPRNLIAIWGVKLFYFFLIPFSLLGLIIVIALQFIDQKRKGATMRGRLRERFGRNRHKVQMVQRFTVRERLEHLGSLTTFIGLVVTGLPQARPSLAIAHDIINFFGGIETTRIIHRVFGFTFVTLMVMHLGTAILRALRKRRLPVMAPTTQDFFDALGVLKHLVFGTPRPKTGKFDFSEKYEYWGLFLGGTLMSVTGVALVFPELVTQFLPGIVIAVFRTMHGLEATFAVLVVALWHSYSVMLRPEVFPLDTSMITGKISVERLEEEHGREYDELFPDGHEAEEEEERELMVV